MRLLFVARIATALVLSGAGSGGASLPGIAAPTAEEEARLKAFIELKYARLRWAEPEYRSVRLKELGAIRKGVKRLADEKASRGGRMASLSSEG